MFTVLLILVQRHRWSLINASISLIVFRSLSKTVDVLRSICYHSTPSMSRLVQPKRRSKQSTTCRSVFFFPSYKVKDKAGLFVQQLIVRPARRCPPACLISPCFQLRKDFLLVLMVPVWTGSSDEEWGAVKDSAGTWGNISGLVSLLKAFCIFVSHTIHSICKRNKYPRWKERLSCLIPSLVNCKISTVIVYFSNIKQDYHSLWWEFALYVSIHL